MKKALIIGGGIGGCVAAIELSNRGWEIDLVEASNSLGAGLKTKFIAGHPCTLGPRHFLTHNEKIYEYMNSLIPLRDCKDHQFISFVEADAAFYSYPIHFDDIRRMPDSEQITRELDSLEAGFRDRQFKLTSGTDFTENESPPKNYKEFWLRSIGPTLYEKFIAKYTRKMWRLEDESIISDFTWSPKGVAIKRGSREGWDTAISAYPRDLTGYDPVFSRAKDCANVIYNTRIADIDTVRRSVRIGESIFSYDLIINSAPIDSVMGNRYGELQYIGRDLTYFILPVEYAMPENVYFSYYCGNEKYTRIVEYKKFTRYQSPHTLLSIEVPSSSGKYYPLPVKEQQERARKYLEDLGDCVFSIGRLGRYNYRYDIDDAVEQALEIIDNL
jgi:UDP-galactopyranose mutase